MLLSRKQTDIALRCALVKVTLDAETANPSLTISRDHKTLHIGEEHQNLPDTSERLMGSASILGSQGSQAEALLGAGGDNWEGMGTTVLGGGHGVCAEEGLSMAIGNMLLYRADLPVTMSTCPC